MVCVGRGRKRRELGGGGVEHLRLRGLGETCLLIVTLLVNIFVDYIRFHEGLLPQIFPKQSVTYLGDSYIIILD